MGLLLLLPLRLLLVPTAAGPGGALGAGRPALAWSSLALHCIEQKAQPVPREQAQPKQVSAGGLASKAKGGSGEPEEEEVAVAVAVAASLESAEETVPPPLSGFVAKKTTLWPLVVYCWFLLLLGESFGRSK